ncbi:hypothetical protein [Microbacterium galbinum]|uniref:hypothetical protein n=1 Tax=Microbacterium galbinum TaxID=2851646 RepID=UPI001FFD7671|nr:hypothetical protein [Microbacterium galbinum]MCK2030317.1 hypothetical protein [Microbacterium galbinum]
MSEVPPVWSSSTQTTSWVGYDCHDVPVIGGVSAGSVCGVAPEPGRQNGGRLTSS